MRFILVFLYLISNNWSNAQTPVSWEFSYDKLSSSILVKGIIDEGWHLYSQKTPANSGPIPVTINITKKKGLILIGKFQEKLEPHEIFDVNFDSKVYLFENSYLSYQKIKSKNKLISVLFLVVGIQKYQVMQEEKKADRLIDAVHLLL